MRELKFRAWKSGKMHMNIGIHPHICQDHTRHDPDDFCYINPETTNDGHLTLWNNDPHIMQYTGLKDKNGVEIYEGDIYHQGDYRIKYVVEWHDSGLIGRQIGNKSRAGLSYWIKDIEVIGNIHQNPELLTS